MVTPVAAIARFIPFDQYYKQGQHEKTPASTGVQKARLNELPPSSHVIISEAARRRLAAEQFARLHYDWEI